ncbi:MAG TPA: hypothetical protein P5118_12430 [Planctomycetota bacterium]|nr:hypothetical protein [Planctomycetota bacterium]
MSANTEQGVWHRASPACRQMLACLALVALTLCTFGNTLWNQFISFDDWFLVEENERIRSLAPRSIAAMLVSKDPSSHAWLPLRELSYAVDYAFWGLNPVGYHLTNVLLHAANTVLCYGVLRWLLRRQAWRCSGRRLSQCIPPRWSPWPGCPVAATCSTPSSTFSPSWRSWRTSAAREEAAGCSTACRWPAWLRRSCRRHRP